MALNPQQKRVRMANLRMEIGSLQSKIDKANPTSELKEIYTKRLTDLEAKLRELRGNA